MPLLPPQQAYISNIHFHSSNSETVFDVGSIYLSTAPDRLSNQLQSILLQTSCDDGHNQKVLPISLLRPPALLVFPFPLPLSSLNLGTGLFCIGVLFRAEHSLSIWCRCVGDLQARPFSEDMQTLASCLHGCIVLR